uniref:Uncharacterized protein n=1 Tax=Arundo donax TaxID=35708 RepID=A0A0A9CS95_ARUDO
MLSYQTTLILGTSPVLLQSRIHHILRDGCFEQPIIVVIKREAQKLMIVIRWQKEQPL